MDHPRSVGGGEDNTGIPDDLRCKRSDGKQWRCTAMSMPDKTVCEKHYIQAKKRAANSAMRASMKKAKRKPSGESDTYRESKSDDMDVPLISQFGDYSGSALKKKNAKFSKSQANYSPEMAAVRSFSGRSSLRSTDDLDRDGSEYEDSRRSYRTPSSAVDSDRSRSQKMLDDSLETSDGSLDSSDDNVGQPCHHCRGNIRDGVIWCLKCERRGYCESCILTWYSDIPIEDIQRVCPACRGTCSCRVCMQRDNLIKARIREIPAKDKLQYLYSLLSAVLPIVKKIHSEQCHEVALEKSFLGNEIDISRTKLNADEQMCCNFCRIPIIDYHRHCTNCSYDLCLSCCKDVREASKPSVEEEINHAVLVTVEKDKRIAAERVKLSDVQLNYFKSFVDWKTNSDGSILCPPKAYGGCGSSFLTLKRIFKMHWVAKLVKNVEEMVNGCTVEVVSSVDAEQSGLNMKHLKASYKNSDCDNFLYCPSSEDLKNEGIKVFRTHWSRGKPVIVKEVYDASATTTWDPLVIWRVIKETADEKMKGAHRIVKAVDCIDWTEINIDLEEFMRGYFDGRVNEKGQPQLLKLKDWPSPCGAEEFLLYQRPEFISKIPLLEFIHSKWGLLNVAAKLPHYSLQNDVGPKIFISYGREEEFGDGDCTDNLHLNARDMVFLLLHTFEVKSKINQKTKLQMQNTPDNHLNSGGLPNWSLNGPDEVRIHSSDFDKRDTEHIEASSFVVVKPAGDLASGSSEKVLEKSEAGAFWDVVRREDIPKLMDYISMHCKEFRMADNIIDDCPSRPVYDGVVYLNTYHISKLKEEFGVEPWSFEQHIGEAVFVPAGCPFQVRHLQSSVQLGFDFLSPESLGQAVRLSEEIRGLPNNHEAKLQVLEVEKISLYAASASIKEVQKLVLDPRVGPELGFEDPNLTSLVSRNLENMIKHRQITCN